MISCEQEEIVEKYSDHFFSLLNVSVDHEIWHGDLITRLKSASVPRQELKTLMLQYYFYVKDFARWLEAIYGNAQSPFEQAALVNNIAEEKGRGAPGEKPHAVLLAELLAKMGIDLDERALPLAKTQVAYSYFNDMSKNNAAWQALYAFGPGTEQISDLFLEPMENAIKTEYGFRGDIDYFLVHKEETEKEHAIAFKIAIASHLESLPPSERGFRMEEGLSITLAAVEAHATFFSGIQKLLTTLH